MMNAANAMTRSSNSPFRTARVLLAAALLVLTPACGGEAPQEETVTQDQTPQDQTPQDSNEVSNNGSDHKTLKTPPAQWDADSLVLGCVRATACGVKPYPRVSNCVDYYRDMLIPMGEAPLYDQIYRCANQASNTCADVAATCFGVNGACGSSFSASCSGGKAIFCDLLDKAVMSYDCAAAGMTCQLDSQYAFAAKCVGGKADANSAPAAQPLKTDLSCAGGVCTKTGQACSSDSFNRCDASGKMEACLDGQWVAFDCGRLGLGSCQVMSGGWGTCGSGQ